MFKNYSIKCDVKNCKHNADGCNCCLDCVKITKESADGSTRCDDFYER
ncbi:MAG: DUF1540 domain-containing protein [Clostridia bacterium]|nr:DUF1540 domain-containing protein [Clostridia bacterium]